MTALTLKSIFITDRKGLPDVLTSYDLVKALAILLVIVDHLGAFFFPEQLWFRAFGRACIPIWCFLIGYARGRNLGAPIWTWAILDTAASFVAGGPIFPTTVLFTFIVTRLILDKVAPAIFQNWEVLIYSTFFLTLVSVPTFVLSDYGGFAFLMALSGWAARNRDQIKISTTGLNVFMGYTVLVYAVVQLLVFHFPPIMGKAAAFGILLTSFVMYIFRPRELGEWEVYIPAPVNALVKFLGRYTLEIYGIHLILFKLVAAALAIGTYGWFQWYWLVQAAQVIRGGVPGVTP